MSLASEAKKTEAPAGLERLVSRSGNTRNTGRAAMAFFQRHKTLGYMAATGALSVIAGGVGLAAGSYLPIESALANVGVHGDFGSYPKAFAMTLSAASTRFLLDFAAAPFLHKVNSDLYQTDEAAGNKHEFTRRYMLYSGISRAWEGLVAGVPLGYMLDNGVPLIAALALNGKPSSMVTVPTKFLLYQRMILKENPWTALKAATKQYVNSAAERLQDTQRTMRAAAKQVSYQLTMFTTSAIF